MASRSGTVQKRSRLIFFVWNDRHLVVSRHGSTVRAALFQTPDAATPKVAFAVARISDEAKNGRRVMLLHGTAGEMLELACSVADLQTWLNFVQEQLLVAQSSAGPTSEVSEPPAATPVAAPRKRQQRLSMIAPLSSATLQRLSMDPSATTTVAIDVAPAAAAAAPAVPRVSVAPDSIETTTTTTTQSAAPQPLTADLPVLPADWETAFQQSLTAASGASSLSAVWQLLGLLRQFHEAASQHVRALVDEYVCPEAQKRVGRPVVAKTVAARLRGRQSTGMRLLKVPCRLVLVVNFMD